MKKNPLHDLSLQSWVFLGSFWKQVSDGDLALAWNQSCLEPLIILYMLDHHPDIKGPKASGTRLKVWVLRDGWIWDQTCPKSGQHTSRKSDLTYIEIIRGPSCLQPQTNESSKARSQTRFDTLTPSTRIGLTYAVASLITAYPYISVCGHTLGYYTFVIAKLPFL